MNRSQSLKGPLLSKDGSKTDDSMAELGSLTAEDQPHSFSSCSREKTSMAALPDVALLDVLMRLDTSQLLEARSVCQRWNHLALEPRVWRRRQVWNWEPGLQRFALRLAPCLRALHVDSNELVARTHCAVTELNLAVTSAALAEEAVRRQVELGRLRDLSLRFQFHSEPRRCTLEERTALAGLFAAVSTGLVEKLSIFDDCVTADFEEPMMGAFQAVRNDRLRASVKVLNCECASQRLALAVQFLLQTHAPTLEVVILGEELLPLSELPALPRLRELDVECFPLADMSPLLQSRALETVRLALKCHQEDLPCACASLKAYAEFLRCATWLRNVTLYLYEPYSTELDLVSALGASGTSELRQLHLVGEWDRGESNGEDEEEDVEELLVHRLMIALPGLLHLHTLTVDPGMSPEGVLVLLDLMSPSTTPSLVLLDLKLDALLKEPCCHDWVHRCEVIGALRRNPRLHVRFNHWPSDCDGELYSKEHRYSQQCRACSFGCHSELQMQDNLDLLSFVPYDPFNKDDDECLGVTTTLLFSHNLGEQSDQHGDSAHPISLADDEEAFSKFVSPCGKSQCSHCHSDK